MKLLLNYIYNRSLDTNDATIDLYNNIEKVNNDSYFNHFSEVVFKNTKIPKEIIKKFCKKYVADNFDYKYSKRISSKLYNFNYISFFLRSIIFLFIIFLSIRPKPKKKCFDLIIDNVNNYDQLLNFERLIKYFKENNVVIVMATNNEINNTNIKIERFIRRNINYLSVFMLLKVFFSLIPVLKLTINSKFNFFALYLSLLDEFFYYNSLFKKINAKYLINNQQFDTNSIKKYLFKLHGGKCFATIEKSIFQIGKLGFYHDTDLLLSRGNTGFKRIFKYGANIKKISTVGSFYMENSWFKNMNLHKNNFPKYDILLLGMIYFDWQDIHDDFESIYYQQYEWLVKIKSEFKNLKIAVAFQKNRKIDNQTINILYNSGVEIIVPNNSYTGYGLGLNSELNLCSCSTIGWELIGHKKKCYFIDINEKNSIYFSHEEDQIKKLKLTNFNQLKKIVIDTFIKKDNIFPANIDINDYCLDSVDTSKNIYKSLNNFI